jgi:hypothetical protein
MLSSHRRVCLATRNITKCFGCLKKWERRLERNPYCFSLTELIRRTGENYTLYRYWMSKHIDITPYIVIENHWISEHTILFLVWSPSYSRTALNKTIFRKCMSFFLLFGHSFIPFLFVSHISASPSSRAKQALVWRRVVWSRGCMCHPGRANFSLSQWSFVKTTRTCKSSVYILHTSAECAAQMCIVLCYICKVPGCNLGYQITIVAAFCGFTQSVQ